MANIEVSSICNLSCPYCFAQKHIDDSSAGGIPSFISLDDFDIRLDFLDRSGINQVRLIGGEPTLHPEFTKLIRKARERNKNILIFSNGLIPGSALDAILDLPPGECTVLINMNSTQKDGKTRHIEQKRLKVIEKLQERALLGFNVYQREFHLDHLLNIIQEFNCQRSLRVGLAHPILGASNKYIHPKDYRQVGVRLVEQAVTAGHCGVRLEFDCGFVRCMFSDDEIEILVRLNTDLGWRCNPVLDIGLAGKVFMCFPTAGWMDVDLSEISDAPQCRNAMILRTEPYRSSGIYPECSDCVYKKVKECSGGGIENIVKRFQHVPFRIKVPSTFSQD